jgi:CubicO group peptidase (beta-lactamase class C family)
MNVLFTAVVLAAFTHLSSAQIASIDRFVIEEMARTHVPGAAVGIYSRGRVLLAKGYGLANVEFGVPVKPQTVFESGSVGKQFTATAIMMLAGEGRISLDDSITKYFPGAPASWKPIRIKNLLSHTSGLAEYATAERTGPGGPFYVRLDYTEDQLLKKIEALPIENAPGAQWNYRNTNYVLLGILIHRVTGMFYGDYLAQKIFKPLGMTSTRVISEKDIIPDRAAGYQWENGALKNEDWVSPTLNTTADGSLYFNVNDLAKWDAALYTSRLLKPSGLKRMWTVYRLNDGKPNSGSYGFAWRIHRQNGHRLLEHSGAWQGFTCTISRYPDDSLTVVVLTNLDSDHARPWYVSQVVAGLADTTLMPHKLTAIPDRETRVAASLGALLDAVAAGKKSDLVAPDDAQAWLKPLWPGGKLVLVQRGPSPEEGSVMLSQFRLTKGTHSLLITYGLNARGAPETLFIEPDEQYRTLEI